jgi:hypothetical protein
MLRRRPRDFRATRSAASLGEIVDDHLGALARQE